MSSRKKSYTEGHAAADPRRTDYSALHEGWYVGGLSGKTRDAYQQSGDETTEDRVPAETGAGRPAGDVCDADVTDPAEKI